MCGITLLGGFRKALWLEVKSLCLVNALALILVTYFGIIRVDLESPIFPFLDMGRE